MMKWLVLQVHSLFVHLFIKFQPKFCTKFRAGTQQIVILYMFLATNLDINRILNPTTTQKIMYTLKEQEKLVVKHLSIIATNFERSDDSSFLLVVLVAYTKKKEYHDDCGHLQLEDLVWNSSCAMLVIFGSSRSKARRDNLSQLYLHNSKFTKSPW